MVLTEFISQERFQTKDISSESAGTHRKVTAIIMQNQDSTYPILGDKAIGSACQQAAHKEKLVLKNTVEKPIKHIKQVVMEELARILESSGLASIEADGLVKSVKVGTEFSVVSSFIRGVPCVFIVDRDKSDNPYVVRIAQGIRR